MPWNNRIVRAREPFPPVSRLPSYPVSGFIGMAVVAALLASNYVWGWWAALTLFVALIVALVFSRSVVERLRWKRHGLYDDPALADVNRWYYRETVDRLLTELITGEKVLMALPAMHRHPRENGVFGRQQLPRSLSSVQVTEARTHFPSATN